MNILSITTQKPHSTGSGTYLTELVRAWDRSGHRQAVVAGIYRSDEVLFPASVRFLLVLFTAPGEAPADIPFPVTGMSDIMPYPSTRYSDLTEETIRQLEQAFVPVVRRAIRELQPDLILCHHLFLLTAILRKHFPEERICGLSHGSDLRQMHNLLTGGAGYRTQAIDPAFVQDQIRDLDRVFALHEAQAERIRELYRVPEERITVIGTGYNAQIFYPPKERAQEAGRPYRVVYAGKLSREKGVPELIRAAGQLDASPDVPPIELHLCGGCQDAEVKRLLGADPDAPLAAGTFRWQQGRLHFSTTEDAGGTGSCVRYHGAVPQTKLAEIFRQSDLFILPSYYEGLPLVLIEAMACGLDTVCTDLPGVRPWITGAVPGCNTRFVPLPEMQSIDVPAPSALPAFVSALADAVRAAMRDRSASGTCGDLPDTSVASWDAVAARFLEAVR